MVRLLELAEGQNACVVRPRRGPKLTARQVRHVLLSRYGQAMDIRSPVNRICDVARGSRLAKQTVRGLLQRYETHGCAYR